VGRRGVPFEEELVKGKVNVLERLTPLRKMWSGKQLARHDQSVPEPSSVGSPRSRRSPIAAIVEADTARHTRPVRCGFVEQ